MQTFDALRASVKSILQESPWNRDWTVQGFGMLRCYLDSDKRFRLNIWDDRLAVPHVSVIHDHPWSFDSWIINGIFHNQRFEEASHGMPYDYMVIIGLLMP